jgi:hypothetical protein
MMGDGVLSVFGYDGRWCTICFGMWWGRLYYRFWDMMGDGILSVLGCGDGGGGVVQSVLGYGGGVVLSVWNVMGDTVLSVLGCGGRCCTLRFGMWWEMLFVKESDVVPI